MNHIVLALDLEMAQPSGHIIQIGACIGSLKTGQIIDKFDVLVNPNEFISPFIEKLTGISNESVKEKGIHQFLRISRQEKPQSGLSKSMNRWGLKFEGRKHNALDDSINTFRLAHFFANREDLK